MAADLVGVIEAAYRVDLPERRWLAGIVAAATPLLDDGAGLFAGLHDSIDPRRFRFRALVGSGVLVDSWARILNAGVRHMEPGDLERALHAGPCFTVSGLLGRDFLRDSPHVQRVALFGVRDGLSVHGLDPSGHGVVLGAPLRKLRGVAPAVAEPWSRVAAHLVAAWRLRRELASSDAARAPRYGLASADAILDPSGRLLEAAPDAQGEEAQVALRTAAIAIDRARGRLRRHDPADAVGAWAALVDGRWTLFDHFDSDGRRYLLARRNEPATAPCPGLSARERQVLAYVAMGHSNKLIAYHLGLAVSTVATHVASGARKLGVDSRVELVRRFSAAAALASTK